MNLLIVAALIWIGVHVGIAGTRLRDRVVARIGDGPFRGRLLAAVDRGDHLPGPRLEHIADRACCGSCPNWLRWILVAAMLPAFVLFVASVSRPNPTMVGAPGGDRAAAARDVPGDPPSDAVVVCDLGGGACRSATAIARRSCSSERSWSRRWPACRRSMPSWHGAIRRRGRRCRRRHRSCRSPRSSPAATGSSCGNRHGLTPAIAVVAWAALLWLHPFLFGVAPVGW